MHCSTVNWYFVFFFFLSYTFILFIFVVTILKILLNMSSSNNNLTLKITGKVMPPQANSCGHRNFVEICISGELVRTGTVLVFSVMLQGLDVLRVCTCIHTYICTSVRITNQLVTSVMLCALILYISDETYNLKSTPNDRFLRNCSW